MNLVNFIMYLNILTQTKNTLNNKNIQFIITSTIISSIGSNAFEGCTALYEFYYLSSNIFTDFPLQLNAKLD